MLEKWEEMEHHENDPSSSSRNNVISPDDVEPEPDATLSDPETDEVQDALAALEDGDGEEDEDTFIDEDFGNNEISALNQQLDQLQSALDEIESRNENIHKELLEILYSNREVRKTISAENQEKMADQSAAAAPCSVTSESNNSSSCVDSSTALLEKTGEIENDARNLMSIINGVADSLQKL